MNKFYTRDSLKNEISNGVSTFYRRFSVLEPFFKEPYRPITMVNFKFNKQ